MHSWLFVHRIAQGSEREGEREHTRVSASFNSKAALVQQATDKFISRYWIFVLPKLRNIAALVRFLGEFACKWNGNQWWWQVLVHLLSRGSRKFPGKAIGKRQGKGWRLKRLIVMICDDSGWVLIDRPSGTIQISNDKYSLAMFGCIGTHFMANRLTG